MPDIENKVNDQFHAVNLRLNRNVEFDRMVSDWIREDKDSGTNISQLIKVLLFAHYLVKQEAEKVV